MKLQWLSLLMGILYIALGTVVLVYKIFVIKLEPNIAYALGSLLILYGIFRIGRAIYELKQSRENP